MGKTALLDRIAVHADGAAVLQVRGVEAEHALAFASLHQLLRPVLPLAADLPEPQRKALEHALAVSPGPAADRLAIGAATLGLLAAAAAELPVVCLLDDANWLDEASAEALVFAARRLGPERVAVVFAVRPSVPEFAPPGVEVLELERLGATTPGSCSPARRVPRSPPRSPASWPPRPPATRSPCGTWRRR